MGTLAVLDLPSWVCYLTETYYSKAEWTFKTVGAANKGHQTQPLTSKHPSDPQNAGEYRIRETCNYAHRHTQTHADLTFDLLRIGSPALFL